MPTVLTSTNYKHARNVTKKSLPEFLPVITFQNLATAKNVSAGILIQTTHFNQCAVPENYPLGPDEIILEGETLKPSHTRRPGMQFIGPVLLTGEFMVSVCLLAYEARRCNYWSKANMEEYLRTWNVRQ
jgi:hypothetical protein